MVPGSHPKYSRMAIRVRELMLLRNKFQPRRKLGSDDEAIASADSLFTMTK